MVNLDVDEEVDHKLASARKREREKGGGRVGEGGGKDEDEMMPEKELVTKVDLNLHQKLSLHK